MFDTVVNVSSLIIALGGLALAVWVVFTGQVQAQGLDAVFLIVVCLAISAMFGMIPAMAIRQGKWNILPSRKGRASAQRSGK